MFEMSVRPAGKCGQLLRFECGSICGSGIIDLISQLFKAGYIDKRGNFTELSEAVDGTFVFAGNISISEAEIKDVIMTKLVCKKHRQ